MKPKPLNMKPTYYQQRDWNEKVCIYKRSAGGDRRMATGMSDPFARLVVKLLNEAEMVEMNAPFPAQDGD